MTELRDIADRMLDMVIGRSHRVDGGSSAFRVAIGGTSIAFDTAAASNEQSLERLATAIEGVIAYDRAKAMLVAAGEGTTPLPLWMITGSSLLAPWLSWSRNEMAFRKVLSLSDLFQIAPISGRLERRARPEIAQLGAKIRVRAGLAVAERIELSRRPRCTASLGHEARIRIEGTLPETIIAGAQGRRISALMDHPALASTDPRLTGIRNAGNGMVIDLENGWGPLIPAPARALAAVPGDADQISPWRATSREIAHLYDLVKAGRRHGKDA